MNRKAHSFMSNSQGRCNICRGQLVHKQRKYCTACMEDAINELAGSGRNINDYLRTKAYANTPDRLHGEQLRLACELALMKWREILADRIGKLNVI